MFGPTANAVLEGNVQGVVVHAVKYTSSLKANNFSDFSSRITLNRATHVVSFTSR